MATSLRLKFKDASDKDLTLSVGYADVSAGASVRPLMEGMIANGAIYDTVPVAIVAAEFVTTTITPVSL